METAEQVALYLADEGKLYQDFYQTVIAPSADPSLQPIAEPPSLEEIKQTVQVWWQRFSARHRQGLQKVIYEISGL